MTVPPLDLFQKSPLTFEKPDEAVFRSIRLAREALIKDGLYPAVFNAANEKAVADFLAGNIGFTDIFDRVEKALDRYDAAPHPDVYTLEDVLEIGRSM